MTRDELPENLYKSMHIVKPYPNTVQPVTEMINITAFFPGGTGLWLEKESEKLPSILVLGQDFSTVDVYQTMLRDGKGELDSATWRNLIILFKEVGIALEACFFSNVFMGLRDTKSMTGEFSGFKDKKFVKRRRHTNKSGEHSGSNDIRGFKYLNKK